MDVDCSSITYETKPSTVVLEAVNKTLDSLEGKNTTEINLSDPTKPENQTISASPNATLANSLLSSIDKDKASKEDIKEAFCRDIDSFSWELGKPERQRQTYASSAGRSVGSIVGMVIGIIAVTALCCCDHTSDYSLIYIYVYVFISVHFITGECAYNDFLE